MATAPQIALRDGSGFTTNLTFTTNQEAITVTGTVGVDTAAVQISVNGQAFVSDPTLISFSNQTLTIPNPLSFPSGLLLEFGVNTIAIRTIDVVGGVSAASTVIVTRVQDVTSIINEIPSGIRVRRQRNSINILAGKPHLTLDPITARFATNVLVAPATTTFRGFNFYASTTPGGTSGYFKLNAAPILQTTTFEEDVISTSSDLAIWDNTILRNIRIKITEENDFGQQLAVRLDKSYSASALSDKLRVTSVLESYRLTEFVKFNHVRSGVTGTLNSDQFVAVSDSDPLYYVVSGVYFDSAQNVEFETPYSQEVLGAPLTIDTTIRDLPPHRSNEIIVSYINAILRVNAEIGIIPGSTTRDVSIDPFASEAERLWFLLDFVHRSQSFLTLLQMDDADGDGQSDSVAVSAYKVALKAALGLQSDDAVQSLIDRQFDKLAANCNKKRLSGRPAVGQAVIYTTAKPIRDIIIPADSFVSADADAALGLPSVRFRIAGSFLLPARTADAYYNFEKKRWQIVVDIVAETIGSTGNRSADSIKNVTGVSGVLVTNDESTVFGTDRESNADLAARAILGFSSVDTGTEGGYASTAAEQLGIVKAKVIKSGDPLMMRDFDTVRKKHAGGKVDIWVQGLRERQVTEKFAFTFEIARDVQCQIIDLTNLIFRVLDSRVTPTTPVIEILNNPVQGLGVRNVTTGQDFDLTGATVLDYQTFQLNRAIAQPTTHIDDVVTADYRFRVLNQFFFTLQPVRRVVTVVGEVSGSLDPSTNYGLYKTDDPLLIGESTVARDYLSIVQFGGKPSGSTISINNDTHVMIGFFQEPLLAIGINTKTIRVFSADRVTEYNGPSSSLPDFDIIEGTATTPVKIVRTAASRIVSGQTVSVDYVHDENFEVTYVINDLLQQFQQVVNGRRHVTADVLVKQAVENSLNVETTIQLSKGATKDKVDPLVRSNVSLELNRKVIGQGSAQSDVIHAIDATPGVDYEIIPLAKMAYADGARRLREGVLSTYVHVSALDIGGNLSYLLTNSLRNPTTDGGGLNTEHRGVFQDDEPMAISSNLASIATAANQAFIIGAGGAILAGFSDDATLIAAGFTTAPDILTERLRRTANHVVVSLSGAGIPSDNPSNHAYAASYVVRGDSGSHDIVAAQVEFIDLGDLTITYKDAS
jgi:hypothetical protein